MGNQREKNRRNHARTSAANSHDEIIVNLVTLLARAAAARDYQRGKDCNRQELPTTKHGQGK
jgi:hypothetical protein